LPSVYHMWNFFNLQSTGDWNQGLVPPASCSQSFCFLFVCLFYRYGLVYLPGAIVGQQPSYLFFLHSWDYRCKPPVPGFFACLFVFVFWDRVLLCNRDWSETGLSWAQTHDLQPLNATIPCWNIFLKEIFRMHQRCFESDLCSWSHSFYFLSSLQRYERYLLYAKKQINTHKKT
jgi:hypothetical protein